MIIAITAVAFTGFSMFRTEMAARVAKLDPGGAQFTYDGKLPHELPHELPRQLQILTKIYSGAYQRFEDLPPEDQHWTRATWEGICNMVPPESVPDYRLKLKEFLEFRTRLALLADNTQRIGMAQQAFAVFRSEQLVGAGIGNYQFLGVNTYKEVMEVARYPHNIVLEHLADGGIIGFLLLATGIAAVIMLAGQALQADGSLVFVAACLAFFMVTSMFSGNYYDFRLFWFVSLLFLRAPWAASMETTASPGRT